MRSPTLDANVQFMQEASQMKNSKHMKLKTFSDPCQTHLLYIISLNLYPLSTLCTLRSITFKKSIFYYEIFKNFYLHSVTQRRSPLHFSFAEDSISAIIGLYVLCHFIFILFIYFEIFPFS